ncbi:photosynthetic reaction center subunit H [Roseisolibacter sp. H3M3-2]|uniref:photosynthetic reaction center subunit H n=1 Tax=Roseisolibacter sp. H3M3-2 TaxID=3031323 RepID=UPI0023DBC0AC|nr:photosynthetic reaction center subunit H [Roseisolibacter sp. H3M3-2]MDF1501860.1 photosynthetic reaction center subunit H [Roseisolibacter sp. H3M3-2]
MTISTSSGVSYSPGSPIQPSGDPLLSGLGPAAFADRSDHPDLTAHGEPKVVPMRVAQNFYVEPRDPDPRGMTMLGADGAVAGTVVDLWVDRSEPQVRYYEVELHDGAGVVLAPFAVCKVVARQGIVRTKAILAAQFANVPRPSNPDQVSLLEEDRIMAYFAGGYLYATPDRARPLV